MLIADIYSGGGSYDVYHEGMTVDQIIDHYLKDEGSYSSVTVSDEQMIFATLTYIGKNGWGQMIAVHKIKNISGVKCVWYAVYSVRNEKNGKFINIEHESQFRF